MFNSWDGPASGADSNDTVGTGDGITTNGGLNPNRNHTRDGKDGNYSVYIFEVIKSTISGEIVM